MFRKLFLIAAALFALAPFSVAPFSVAQAQDDTLIVEFCNDYWEDIDIAISYQDLGDEDTDTWVTEGWFTLAPDECSELIETLNWTIYYFAVDYYEEAYWDGDLDLCTDEYDSFYFVEDDSDDGYCPSGAVTESFVEVDVDTDFDYYTITLE